MLKIDPAKPETSIFLDSMYSSSFSKRAAYITHNAT